MELQAAIEARRSIRRYLDKPVDRETVRTLIGATNLAPSWKNSQASRYYVADGENKERLAEALPPFNRNNTKDAPVLIVTTVVKGLSGYDGEGKPMTKLDDGFQYFDNGLQVQTLCLKAAELGLGTLIMGIYDEAGIRAFFDIPDSEAVVSVIGLGYAAVEPKTPPRKPVDDILRFK